MAGNISLYISELIGKRVIHTFPDYGPGTIKNAWFDFDGSDHVTIAFDHRKEATSSFGLMKCIRSGLIVFEDDRYDEAWLNELLIAENVRRTEKQQAPQNTMVISNCPDLDDFDFFAAAESEVQLTPQQEQEEKNAVYTYLTKERKVQYFVHFTPAENLQGILDHGILSRAELKRLNLPAVTPDEERWDFCLDYSSFSISFPNYRIFYTKRINTDCRYAVLLIDPKVVLDLPYQSVSYLPENAASSKMWNIRQYRGLEAAKGLFAEELTTPNGTIKRSELKIPDHFPTNPQAEVFIGKTVPVKYISKIIVQTYGESRKLKETLKIPSGSDITIEADAEFFWPRVDHRFWSKQKDDTLITGE